MLFLSTLALLAAPLASLALTITTPTDVVSTEQTTITWTTEPGDPSVFSVELVNDIFNNAFAVANNVDVSLGTLTFTLPPVEAGSGYSIQLVNITDINDVYAETPEFSIAAPVTSASSSSSASLSASSATSASEATATDISSSEIVSASSSAPGTLSSVSPDTATSTGTAAGSEETEESNTDGVSALRVPALMLSGVAAVVAFAL